MPTSPPAQPSPQAAADALQPLLTTTPQVAVVLGSGLGDFIQALSAPRSMSFDEVPGLPTSSVAGHAGRFVFGDCQGVPVIAMQGRVHLYEGHTASEVVLGVRAMLRCGAKTLLLTNAAGGVHPDFRPGDLMLIRDHLNLTGQNCLVGANDEALGPRFPDMSAVYDAALCERALEAAAAENLPLREGVYAGLLGPSYETPAEVRMLRTLGADAVGMSTVLEAIAARHMGAACLGISCITNAAAGLSDSPLSHAEVQETAATARDAFSRLVSAIISPG